MPTLSIIVAVDQNNAIGKENSLLCYLPNDLKYFKSVTQGRTIIMGHKTYDSLPNGALPNRRNIVLSKNNELELDRCEIANSLHEAINLCKDEDEVFIIGGATVYDKAIDIADKLYVTNIHHTFDKADAFFPKVDTTKWKVISELRNDSDEKNNYSHTFRIYDRE